jgi:hypothetical protein
MSMKGWKLNVPDAIGLPQNGFDLSFISQVHCALSAKVNLLTNDLCTTFNSESLCCAHMVYLGVMYFSYSKQLLLIGHLNFVMGT